MESGVNMSRHIVVDGFPKGVPPARHDFFRGFLTKSISQKLGHSNFVVHLNIDHSTGFLIGAFLTFVRQAEAENALALLNRHALTKTDMLLTYRWSSLPAADEEIGEYHVPDYQPELATDVSNAMMEDPMARPMFLTKSGQHLDVELFWYDNAKQRVDLFKKPSAARDDNLGQMTEMDRKMKMAQPGVIVGMTSVKKPLPVWTPLGSMLVTQHYSGLKFWGGESFSLLFEIAEPSVTAFHISPMENFLVVRSDREVAVWNLKQTRKMKVMAGFDPNMWPLGKFNADDSLVAFNKGGDLLVYDTNNEMTLVQSGEEKHSYTMRLPDLKDFEWSPSQPNQIALVYCGNQHVGWSVSMEDFNVTDNIATLTSLFRRNFLGAHQVNVLWHPEGNGLAAKITKFEKGYDSCVEAKRRCELEAKKLQGEREHLTLAIKNAAGEADPLQVAALEATVERIGKNDDELEKAIQGITFPTVAVVEYCLFKIHLKTITADHFKIESKFSAERFAWQPGGKYFAVLLLDKSSLNGPSVTGPKMTIRFYGVDSKGLKMVGSFATSANSLHWAPRGTRLVAANYEKSLFEFYGINDAGVALQFEKCEHPAVGDTQWDPSGRFFASWNTCLRNPEGCRYRIFDMNGVRILEKRIEKLSHLAWRPLAKQVLTAEEMNQIRSNLKTIIASYEAADQAIEESQEKAAREKQEKAESEYKTRMNAIARFHAEKKYAEVREYLRASAPMAVRQSEFLASLPADVRTITETLTETRVKSREEVKR